MEEKFINHLEEFDETTLTENSKVVMIVGSVGTYVIIKHNEDTEEETITSVLENDECYYECMSSTIEEDPEFKTIRYAIALTIFVTEKYNLSHVLWVENETYKAYVDKAIIVE